MVINTNLAALRSATNLNNSSSLLNLSLARLSSGSKIVSPADDPAGLAESTLLTAQIGETSATNANIGNAIAFGQTQDGYLQQVGAALDQMSTLAVQAEDGTKTDVERADYQKEFATLSSYVNDVMNKNFNGVSLFSSGGLNVTTDSNGDAFHMQGVSANYVTPTSTITSTATVGYAVSTQLSQFAFPAGASQGFINGDQNGVVNGSLDGVNGNLNGVVNGAVNGPVNGDVNGNVNGGITGGVNGSVNGNVNGDIDNGINGNLSGNVNGNVTDGINGDLSGTINGDFSGIISGNFTGKITGTFSGFVVGSNSGTVGAPVADKLTVSNSSGVQFQTNLSGNGTISDLVNFLNSTGGATSATYDASTGQLSVTAAAGYSLAEQGGTALARLGVADNFNSQGVNTLDNIAGGSALSASATMAHSVTTTTTVSNGAPDISTTTGAATALASLTTAIAQLATDRATIGSNLERLNFTSSSLEILNNNLSASNSKITDVDVAEESTNFARYQILVQAGTSMLAQANSSPQSILKLLS